MKRIFLLFILLFGLHPVIKDGYFKLLNLNAVMAQSNLPVVEVCFGESEETFISSWTNIDTYLVCTVMEDCPTRQFDRYGECVYKDRENPNYVEPPSPPEPGTGGGPSGGGGGGGGGGGAAGGSGGSGGGGDGDGGGECTTCGCGGSVPITSGHDITNHFGTSFPETSKYRVTVYAEEPVPGATGVGGSYANGNAGHAFLGITMDGTTRFIGFYPESSVANIVFTGITVDGELHDNKDSAFTVSKDYPLNNEEFANLMEFVNNFNGETYEYNLYYRNCTNWILDAMKYIGKEIPSVNAPGPTTKSPEQLANDLKAQGPTNNRIGITPCN